MKQITMNGTANALQVAAVLFLFGDSLLSAVKPVKENTVNKTVHAPKQNDQKRNSTGSNDVMTSYFHTMVPGKITVPLFIHPVPSPVPSSPEPGNK